MTDPLLELKDVSISLGDKRIVTKAKMQVDAGECVALTGPSGAGKSTLLQAICQLLPDIHDGEQVQLTGSICYQGKNLTTLTERQWQALRGVEIGLLLQNAADNFDERKSVFSHFVEAVHAHNKKVPKEAIEKEAVRRLYQLQLAYPERILKQHSYEFSVGMCQRLSLALALMLKPKLLLADEFTSALDIYTRLEVLRQLKELQQEYGFALLFITHSQDEAAFMATRRYELKDGTLTTVTTAPAPATVPTPAEAKTDARIGGGLL